MEFWFEALEEAVRTALLVLGAGFLAWRGHTHGLRGRPGWGLILSGLLLLAVGSAIDLGDEFAAFAQLPAFLVSEPWGLFEIFTEFVSPAIGTSLLILGFLLWLPLAARLSLAERQVREGARRQAEEHRQRVRALEEVAAMKSRFLNSAAHELSTPLTPIKLQVASLRGALFGELTPIQSDAVGLLDRNLDRLGLIVRDLLDGARLQSGQLAVHRKPTPLGPLAADVVRSFAQTALRDGITLTGRGLSEDVAVDGDAARLSQVATNLVSNALKFTPSGGTVELSIAREGDEAVLAVRDDGPGLDAEQMGRIFEPFAQVHETRDGALGGSGLGLYISKGIVEQHGGRLTCRSEGRGRGCTFEVRLPKPILAYPVEAQAAGTGMMAVSPGALPA